MQSLNWWGEYLDDALQYIKKRKKRALFIVGAILLILFFQGLVPELGVKAANLFFNKDQSMPPVIPHSSVYSPTITPVQANSGGTNTQINNINIVDPKPSRNYGTNFLQDNKDIKEILDKNKNLFIEIFAATSTREIGDFACSIHAGLGTDGFSVSIWPDTDLPSGFENMPCIENFYQLQRKLFLPALQDFESVKHHLPLKATEDIKLFNLDSKTMILWITK